MGADKLTQDEARRLLEMLKRSLVDAINFPMRGTNKEFDVIGETKSDIFSINIYRARIKPDKYNIGARIKKNGIMLLELHINPTNVHSNPDGEKITGSHWHVYKEGYGRLFAYPADDIEKDKFVENTMTFLEKFNVVEPPNIFHQLEIL